MLIVWTMVNLIPVTHTPHPHPPPPNLLISLLPSPQFDATRTIWEGSKCRNRKQGKKRKLNRKNWKGNL